MPLDARGVALFDTVEGKHYQCEMDNLYNSAIFFKAAYNNKKQVLNRGVKSKVMQGMLSCIKQEELNSKKSQIYTRGIANAEVPVEDPKLTKLIKAGVYYTKYLHYTSMISK